jgi:5-formyltetrahydrofolate cyclo-ligase
MTPEQIRRKMIRQRRDVSHVLLRDNSTAIARSLWQLPVMRRAGRIAAYQAFGGEIDCAPLIKRARAAGRELFLPVLHRGALRFAPFTPSATLIRNRFGIDEPAVAPAHQRSGFSLDVVLTPLVAFDLSGNRLGMGGGYYDRSFAFRRQQQAWRRPLLIGLAHEFQLIETLHAEPWDIPLDIAVTETRVYTF